MTFFTIYSACLLGQLTALSILGVVAKRIEKKREKQLLSALEEYNGLMQRESQRIQEYARMES